MAIAPEVEADEVIGPCDGCGSEEGRFTIVSSAPPAEVLCDNCRPRTKYETEEKQ